MGILDFLSGQFIDVIHWTDDTRDTMVSRFEREGHEIKYGAKLTVREGQAAVFVHEGQLADVFTPGLYMLETNNMPIMTSLQHWDHGFKSPFKSEIYFVNTTRFNDLKWGTKNPIIVRDPEFGPVRLRSYGTYSVKVSDPARFLTEIVGTDGEFTMDEISYQIRNIIVQEFSRVIAGSGIPVLDMAANTGEFGKLVAKEISGTIAEYGLTLPELYIENISLPPAVEEVLDKVGDLFDARVRHLYSAEDREKGWIEILNRQKESTRYPITSLSIGVSTNDKRELSNALEVSEIATELKKAAKARSPGRSNYIIDRRTS